MNTFKGHPDLIPYIEPIDFVHIYETQTYNSSQVIDMFGDIAGASKC